MVETCGPSARETRTEARSRIDCGTSTSVSSPVVRLALPPNERVGDLRFFLMGPPRTGRRTDGRTAAWQWSLLLVVYAPSPRHETAANASIAIVGLHRFTSTSSSSSSLTAATVAEELLQSFGVVVVVVSGEL